MKQLYSIGFVLLYVLWVIAVSCKLAGITTLSWGTILFPIWAPFALMALVISGVFLYLFVALIGVLYENKI